MKNKIKEVFFDTLPVINIRTIDFNDSKELKKHKIKFPFELENDVCVTVLTTLSEHAFKIDSGYIWNGADIPRFLWRIFGSKTDNVFLTASMVHDYLLENKKTILNYTLNNTISPSEYRKLTSQIFGEILKCSGTNKLKANTMSFAVDFYQKFFNGKEWKLCNPN